MTGSPSPSRSRPVSDVSSGVGLVGLLGLFFWIAICRNWAGIAEVLALPGPREPMSGPYASLATLLFTGVPMVAWSLLVDKVHLRASTGIDWHRQPADAPPLSVSGTKIAGLWATFALIGFCYCVARWYWDGSYLFAIEVLAFSSVPLVLLTVPYVWWLDRYMVEPRDGAWHFGAMLIGREVYDPDAVMSHLRSWAVKGFFIAFMFSILPGGFDWVVNMDLSGIAADPVKLAGGLIQVLFLIDVQLAMVGYLLTFRPLDAHIRSANPYVSGWVAALICYPPFILMGAILDSSSIMLILVPLMLPVLAPMGVDLIWFGIVTVIAVEVGLLTPPFGISVFVIKSALDDPSISLGDIFLGAAPFALLMLLVLALVLAFPILATGLI